MSKRECAQPCVKNQAPKWIFYLAHVLVIVWMVFIFYMSAQPGDTSGEISGGVSHMFVQIWNSIFGLGWNEGEILHMAEIWDYPIRKLAHMTEFGILAMLVYWAFGLYAKLWGSVQLGEIGKIRAWISKHKRYVAAWLLTICYAATDEIHQVFVPDRNGNLFDVVVDGTGAVIALLFIYAWMRCVAIFIFKASDNNKKK